MFRSQRILQGNFLHVDRVETERRSSEEVVGVNKGDYSVAALAHSPELEMIFLVSQDRAAMRTERNPMGKITEAVAGRCDIRNERVTKTMVREILEELGVEATEEDIEIVATKPQATSPGCLREKIYLGYYEIKPSSVVKEGEVFGLKEEGEKTKVIGIPSADAETYAYEECEDIKTFALLMWFVNRQRKTKLEQGVATTLHKVIGIFEK